MITDMKQEDKELLLKDLSGRLPYGVKIRNVRNNFDISSFDNNVKEIKVLIEEYNIKPYLRPMSSMTKGEEFEYHNVFVCPINNQWDVVDWLLAHHFDFRGLIEKGLAFEASEGMYNT